MGFGIFFPVLEKPRHSFWRKPRCWAFPNVFFATLNTLWQVPSSSTTVNRSSHCECVWVSLYCEVEQCRIKQTWEQNCRKTKNLEGVVLGLRRSLEAVRFKFRWRQVEVQEKMYLRSPFAILLSFRWVMITPFSIRTTKTWLSHSGLWPSCLCLYCSGCTPVAPGLVS